MKPQVRAFPAYLSSSSVNWNNKVMTNMRILVNETNNQHMIWVFCSRFDANALKKPEFGAATT